MTTFVKTGGSFRVGVINPDTGFVDSFTEPQLNDILSVGKPAMFTGLPSYLPIQLGSSDAVTDVLTQTGAVSPLLVEINSIETDAIPTTGLMPFDGTSILLIRGKTNFQLEMLEGGELNEVAIENFCRARLSTPILVDIGSTIAIEYNFTLYLQFPTMASPTFNGVFKDPVTDEVQTFEARTRSEILDPTAQYRWYELLSGFNKAFVTPDIASLSEPIRVLPDALTVTNTADAQDVWVTLAGTSLPDNKIGSVYFGNPHFGLVLNFHHVESDSIQPLPISTTHQLSLLLSIDWF